MNTMHLRYAVEIEKTGSISQAANNLFMSQPNLSKAIKELEAALHITIFQRSSKGVTPTPKGRQFLISAKRILRELDEMEALGREQDRRVSFKTSVLPASYIVYGFTRFLDRLDVHESLDIDFREATSADVLSAVEHGSSNSGIIRTRVEDWHYAERMLEEKSLRCDNIWEFSPLLLFSEHHPLAGKQELTVADLVPYLQIRNRDLLRESAIPGMEALTEHDQKLAMKIYDRHSQMHFLQRMEGTYMWTSPLPEALLKENGLVQRPCRDNPLRCVDMMIYGSEYEPGPLDRMFLTELTQIRRELASLRRR